MKLHYSDFVIGLVAPEATKLKKREIFFVLLASAINRKIASLATHSAVLNS
jgi:hypothetical protein